MKGFKENIFILVIIQNENGLILIFSKKIPQNNVEHFKITLNIVRNKNCTMKGMKSLKKWYIGGYSSI